MHALLELLLKNNRVQELSQAICKARYQPDLLPISR